jgi:hypothetical protein
MTEREARTGARFAREKQVLRCAQNDNQKGKGKGKGKGKSKGKSKSKSNGKSNGKPKPKPNSKCQCGDLSTALCFGRDDRAWAG